MLRVFKNNDLKIHTVKNNDQFYFKAKEVALALGYQNTKHAVSVHVSDECKKRWSEIKGNAAFQPHAVFITEVGLYEMIFRSKLPAADEFRKWIFNEVLPALRKNKQPIITESHLFKIENEYDLHRKVVEYIRRFHDLILVAGLGEYQDTSSKRIQCYQKGYQKGQPDLIIQNRHMKYSGFCIEFKTPNGKGVLSAAQKETLDNYRQQGYLTLVSNDYDVIIRTLEDYCRGLKH